MDVQKIILVLIVIVLLAGLAYELKYIEESLVLSGMPADEQCERLCSEKGEVAYVTENVCYCKEPVSFRKSWRCFWNVTFENSDIFSSKFNASSIRNTAVKSVVKYAAPNNPATRVFGIYNEISNNIHYVSDPRRDEYIATPLETWDTRGGDCDDFSVLMASMYEAVGIDAKIVDVYNVEQGHVFVILKIEQDLDSFLRFYKIMLEKYTSHYSEKSMNIMLEGETQKECEALEKAMETGKEINSFYLVVDSTRGDYPGSRDAFQGYDHITFVEVGG